MKFEDDDLMRVWQKASRDADTAACVSSEILARAATGAAMLSEREQVADHLARCARCSDEYRVIAAMNPWVDRTAGVNPPLRAQNRRRLAYYAAAAAVVALVTGLGWWVAALRVENARLAAAAEGGIAGLESSGRRATEAERSAEQQQREVARLEERLALAMRPALNVPIVDLDPDQSARGAPRSRVVSVRTRGPWLTFVITAGSHAPAPSYDVEIADDQGHIVWTGSGLDRSAYGTFTMIVPTGLLESKVSHVRLFARRDKGRELLQDYAVRVEKE